MSEPELRYGFEDEEAVQQWRAAEEYLRDPVRWSLYRRVVLAAHQKLTSRV